MSERKHVMENAFVIIAHERCFYQLNSVISKLGYDASVFSDNPLRYLFK